MTDDLFYYQGMLDGGPVKGRTPVLILWLGADLLVTESLRSTIRHVVEANEQCPETWLLYPAHLHDRVVGLVNGGLRDRFENEVGFTYRLIAVGGDGGWSERERIGEDSHRVPRELIPTYAESLTQQGLRQIFRDTNALFSSGPAFHFAKPSGAHTSYFLRASETSNQSLHASFIAVSLLPKVEKTPLRMLSDTAGVHPVLFHLRTLLTELRGAPTIPIDSFGGYESFEAWISRISSEDLVVISSSTSGALAGKIALRLKDNCPPLLTLFYLAAEPDKASTVLCDLTRRNDDFAGLGPLGAFIDPLPSTRNDDGECKLCAQRVPVLPLEGDNFLPRPDGLELRMVTRRVLDKHPIDRSAEGKRIQTDFFDDFYGLDLLEMHADYRDAGGDSRRQFRTSVAHLLDDTETHGRNFRKEMLTLRAALLKQLSMKSVDVFVATKDEDSTALARWLAAETFRKGVVTPDPRVFVRAGLTLDGSGFPEALASIPDGSSVVGVASVVSTGRALLDLSRSLRVAPDEVKIGYLAAIGHPPSLSAWQILVDTLRWTAGDRQSDFRVGWLLERDPLEVGAETAWTAEIAIAREVAQLSTSLPDEIAASEARIVELESRPLHPRSLFVDPDFDGSNGVRLRPINKGFIAWTFAYESRERRDKLPGADQVEVFASISHMLHRSRFPDADTQAGRLSSRLPAAVLNPANFDRYNDPQIQAAFLRAAHPGELDYRSDDDGSRAMTEVVLHSLANLGEEAGAAAAEFVIALLIGFNRTPRSGLLLTDNHLKEVARRLEIIAAEPGRNLQPYLRGLIRLLTQKATHPPRL